MCFGLNTFNKKEKSRVPVKVSSDSFRYRYFSGLPARVPTGRNNSHWNELSPLNLGILLFFSYSQPDSPLVEWLWREVAPTGAGRSPARSAHCAWWPRRPPDRWRCRERACRRCPPCGTSAPGTPLRRSCRRR